MFVQQGVLGQTWPQMARLQEGQRLRKRKSIFACLKRGYATQMAVLIGK